MPNSGSDSAKEMTKTLACDDRTEAQLPPYTHPETRPNTSAGPTAFMATAWGSGCSSLGSLWQCILESLKWAERVRALGFEAVQNLAWLAADSTS